MSVGTTSALATNALSASWKLEDKGEIGTRHHLLNTPASHTETPTPASAEREHMEGMDKSNESRRLLLDYDDFHDAIKYGDFDSVKQMLDDGANVERDTDDGETPLVLAIHKQHTDIITLLLENGADVNYPSNDLPPLFHAVTQKERAPHIIQLLLDYGAHLDAVVGPSDMTALHWAAVHGMKHAVDILVSKGSSMSRTCAKGQTPFTLAAENGHLVVVQLLLAKGADLHERSSNGGSALIWAASRGQHEVVDYLLSAGSKVDDRSKDGLTALSLASMFGHLDVLELLIKGGADVNVRGSSPDHFTPAMFAAGMGHAEALQALLSHGADPRVEMSDGTTILELAMKGGHLATVRILLEALGGSEYPKDSVALQLAVAQSKSTMRSLMTTVSIMHRYIDIEPAGSESLGWVQWVVDQGGELVRSMAMRNMLHIALADKDIGVTAELLKLGADPNTVGLSGNTPLHVAVGVHNLELINMLLEAGADPAKRSENSIGLKITPLHYAVFDYEDNRVRDMSVINLLLASGRCKVMDGGDAQSTAFACVVRGFDRWDDGVAEKLAWRMLKSIPNVNEDRSDDGSTLMHVAVYYKKNDLVDALRRQGADIDAKNNDGHSPLLVACRSAVDMVNFLITRCADVSAVDSHGQGVLHIAAACGQVEILGFLVDLDLADGQLLNMDAIDDAGHTPLVVAIANEHEDAALLLLEGGASNRYPTTDKGRYALHYAAQAGMERVVEMMLEDPESINTINAQDDRGYTPLALACIAPASTVVSDLLSHGADPNTLIHTTGDRPLHMALKRPLHMRPRDARYGSPVLALLNHEEIELTARDSKGRTPLHLASEFHNLPATQLLLSKGVSPHYENDRAQTPLCLCSSPDIAQALIDHGAHVDHGDENGWTPLHYAVSRCWVKAFAVLRRAGADMDLRTRDDGLSVTERLKRFGTWEDWVNAEREYMYDDAQRERTREEDMKADL